MGDDFMKATEIWLAFDSYAICPKCFFSDKRYTSLSANAKLLYIFLFDRTRLSAHNGLCDTDGEVFVFCTVDTACEVLGCTGNTAIKAFRELEDASLLYRVRTGVMRTYQIYLLKPCSL